MREFFRRLKVRQKVFVLLAIAMVGISLLNVSSNFWLATQNPIQQHLSVLTPLLHGPNQKEFTSTQWLEFLNQEQVAFTITDTAIYNVNGKKLNSTSDDFPLHLSQIHLTPLDHDTVLLPGPKFTLMAKVTAHVTKIFLLEVVIISLLILVSGFALIYVILYFINRLIIRPIFSLTDTTNEIAMEQNYGLRARRFYPDEIGTLAENFNYMLNRIEQDDMMLRQEKEKAEQARQRALELSKKMHDTNARLGFEVKVRARVEHKLTDFQHYLNNIIDSMPSAIIAIDHELKVTQWNKGATQITHIKRDDAIYQPLEESCGFLFAYLTLITNSLEKKVINKVERISFDFQGQKSILDLTIYPLDDTTHSGAVIRIDDVTQRTQMEDMMVQSEKMMSLGGLAAGMAHEINNPLGAIVQTVQNIKRRLNPAIQKNIESAELVGDNMENICAYMDQRGIFTFLNNISQAGERASTIVNNMLQFSRQSPKKLQPQNLHHIIDRSISIAKNEYSLSKGYDFKAIDLIKDFDLTLADVPCIPSEIEQVILNLLKNAAQALQEYKLTKEFDLDWYSQIQISTRKNNQMAELIIEDNGPGMDEETTRHIFEPFFTTKEVGMGTGLGLSVSFFIITNHHQGQMRVQSSIGSGTRFTIMLPFATTEQTSQATPA
ncbi:ATP-binding protein [Bermanella sp. WJH001]|uniref:ATP-binding protein n=1 Tax=Bermanella sp. WJH001 TaxID=3048005 RepID=UPI0024BE6899|nr:ATP-binding protein [Bermanella sp. WJH001]MDJ1539663.1 ATP-binding protein [Bermanella sp. WJH001]